MSQVLKWNMFIFAGVQIWVLFLQQISASIAAVGGIQSIVRILHRDETFAIKRIVVAGGAFFIIRIIGVFYSPDFDLAIQHSQYPLLGFLFFFFIDMRDKYGNQVLKRFEQIWLITAIAAAAVGIIKYSMNIESRIGPPFGATVPSGSVSGQPPLGSCTLFAEFLTMTILYFSIPVIRKLNYRKQLYRIIGIVLLGGALLLTFSRSSWLATGAVISSLTLWLNRKLFIILLVLGLLSLLIVPYARERVLQSVNSKDWSTGRVQLWSYAFDKMENHLLMGYGLGSFKTVLTEKERNSLPDTGVGNWHNQYIQIVMESGIIGLVSFLWLIFELYLGMIYGLINITDQYVRGKLIGGIAVLSSVLILSMFETFLSSPVGNVTFFCLMGISVGWMTKDKFSIDG